MLWTVRNKGPYSVSNAAQALQAGAALEYAKGYVANPQEKIVVYPLSFVVPYEVYSTHTTHTTFEIMFSLL